MENKKHPAYFADFSERTALLIKDNLESLKQEFANGGNRTEYNMVYQTAIKDVEYLIQTLIERNVSNGK